MIHGIYRTTPPPAVAYELKTCELCARNFTRQVGTQVKYCGPCSAKPVEREDALSLSEEMERKKPPRKASKKARTAAALEESGVVQELRTRWLNGAGEQRKDPAKEIRDAWLLH